ncbi:MAG: hypothetical protein AB7E52_01165 [Bdellovibrionales bacterium]
MQITPAPPMPPVSTAATEPQALTHGLPQLLTQAAAPITPNAVAPSPKSERSKKAHRRDDQDEEGKSKESSDERGDHVNFSV